MIAGMRGEACLPAQQGGRFKSVHDRHLHVHQHHVERRGFGHADGNLAVVCNFDYQAGINQYFGRDLLVDLVVFGQQNARAADRCQQFNDGFFSQGRQAVDFAAQLAHQGIE